MERKMARRVRGWRTFVVIAALAGSMLAGIGPAAAQAPVESQGISWVDPAEAPSVATRGISWVSARGISWVSSIDAPVVQSRGISWVGGISWVSARGISWVGGISWINARGISWI